MINAKRSVPVSAPRCTQPCSHSTQSTLRMVARLCPSPPNVKFRGTTDNCPRGWRRSGIGARRRSPANSEWLHADSLGLKFDELLLCAPCCRSYRCVQRQELADLRRPALRTACPRAASQDQVLNVSKVASNSSDGAPALGHKRVLPDGRFGVTQLMGCAKLLEQRSRSTWNSVRTAAAN